MMRVPVSRHLTFLLLAAAGLALDLYSKHAVFSRLGFPDGASRKFLDGWLTFRLYTSMNEGALWGVGQGLAWLFAGLSLLAIVGVLYWLFVHGAAVSWWLTISLSSIMAGTLGNLYDRLGFHGCLHPETNELWYAVRDFLLFTFGEFHWPVFNFADVFLVSGACMLVLQSLTAQPHAQTAGESAPPVRRDIAEPSAAVARVANRL